MPTTIERLRAELATVTEQRNTLDRRMHEIQAAIADCEGDALDAEWHRACAAGDHERGHALWIRIMARYHLQAGRTEPVSEYDAEDARAIRAEMDRMREVQP